MAYNQSYSATDISAVTIDLVVGIGAALVGFVTLIGLILLFGWLKKQNIRFG